MKIILFAACFVLASAQRRPVGSSGDRFDPTDSRLSSNGRNRGDNQDTFFGGNSDRGSGSRDSFQSGGNRFPPFFRIEVEVQRLENKNGWRSDGKSCDLTSDCDPRIIAYLDANNPLAPWPGGKPVKEWSPIFEATDNNSPTISKSVNRDVCGGSVSKVNLRVKVEDVDPGISNDLIGNFECLFTIDPRDIARDARSAEWGPSMECTGQTQQGKIRLFARQRAYEITSASCQATDKAANSDNFGSSVGVKRDGEHDFMRIDVELVQLIDPQGITYKKEACDTGNACDPVISAYLDNDKPLAVWPGSKTVPNFTPIFSVNNQNSPIINKNISKNICGGAVSQVNVRVHIDDADNFSNELLEDFECLFTADYRRVARDISSADWSSTEDCKPLHPGHDIRLQYRYRLYDITPVECGIKPPGGSKPSSG